jgi:alkylated DNA repair dioxygenase AlkB
MVEWDQGLSPVVSISMAAECCLLMDRDDRDDEFYSFSLERGWNVCVGGPLMQTQSFVGHVVLHSSSGIRNNDNELLPSSL